jgi:hypothetical protein
LLLLLQSMPLLWIDPSLLPAVCFVVHSLAMRILLPFVIAAVIGGAVALADPYGPPHAVTDMAPFCARCHASTSEAQLPELRPEIAMTETVAEKHIKHIKTGAAYKDLTAAQRETLIDAVTWVDEQATVRITGPVRAKRNNRIEVTVITKGGAGPVIGLSLVDSLLRFQARPIGSSGFKVLGPPMVIGPDHKAQADWIDRRVRGSDLSLSTIMITGIRGDAETQEVSETRTTWNLRTPAEPGVYRIAVAFYYGTEKAHPLGTVIQNGRPEPRGGINGGSGRVMFSNLLSIVVI